MLVEQIHKLYDKEEKVRDRTSFFVSEVDKCPIAIFYAFKKTPKARLGSQAYLRFEVGNDTHKRLVKTLSKLRILIADEVNMPHNNLFRGRADAVVKIDDEFYIVEIKSVSNARFQRLTKAATEHVKQLQLYLYYFNINKGIILVENKNTQELKEFIIEKDIVLINKILTDFEILKTQIANNEMPAKPLNLPGWKCNYCSYKDVCPLFLNPSQ